ncbi:MAG: threonylcarbamoyl-AMP synthase [Candidatus Thermoplasmatota archaeon]|nr:threonylcarbamoyl-AMP synthase [Candidatus Thermoplasmatota archaeon]
MIQNDISAALHALGQGELIVYPTDTLYALGADIYNENAVKKVFDVKRRPYTIPLPVAVSSLKEIESVAWMNEPAEKISKRFLPGNLTIILKKKPSVPSIVTGGADTIGIRIPKHPIALQLLSRYGPLTVTSANIHQKKTQGTITAILKQLGTVIPVCLDDGRKEGTASTIVDLSMNTPRIVREGSIRQQELLDVISHG